jgi:hypothetical protein
MSQITSRLSLRARLLITFVLVFIVALALFGGIAFKVVYDRVVSKAEDDQLEFMEFAANTAPFLIRGEWLPQAIESGDPQSGQGQYIEARLRYSRGPDESINIHTLTRSPETGEPVYVRSTNEEFDARFGEPFEDPALYDALVEELDAQVTVSVNEEGVVDIEVEEPVKEDPVVKGSNLYADGYVPLFTYDSENEDVIITGIAWIDVGPVNITELPNRIITASLGAALLVVPLIIAAVVWVALSIANPVRRLTDAAEVVEKGERFDPESLDVLVGRGDELGQLARVFSRMAVEVQAREAELKRQVAELKIEINEVKKQKHVDEITESDFFKDLQTRARQQRAERSSRQQASSDAEDSAAEVDEAAEDE